MRLRNGSVLRGDPNDVKMIDRAVRQRLYVENSWYES